MKFAVSAQAAVLRSTRLLRNRKDSNRCLSKLLLELFIYRTEVMMCTWTFCPKKSAAQKPSLKNPAPPLLTESSNWGLSRPMCKAALDFCIGKVTTACISIKGNTQGHIEDYARIYALMEDLATIERCLQRLEQAITARPADASPEANWLRFSSVLSYFEKKCGFPEDVLLPMGVLSAEQFYSYIRLGYVLKDYGAGVKHGEFTHRLQWHVIMQVITNNFTTPKRDTWNHSPFELYIKLGVYHGLWALLIDSQGEGALGHYPDTFHAMVLSDSTAFPKLHGFASKREAKRRKEFVDNIMAYISELNQTNNKITTLDEFLKGCNPYASHEQFKKFDAWFQAQLAKQYKSIGKPVIDIMTEIANKSVPQYVQSKTTVPVIPKNRTTPYVSIASGPVYKLSSAAIWTVTEADARGQASEKQFF